MKLLSCHTKAASAIDKELVLPVNTTFYPLFSFHVRYLKNADSGDIILSDTNLTQKHNSCVCGDKGTILTIHK